MRTNPLQVLSGQPEARHECAIYLAFKTFFRGEALRSPLFLFYKLVCLHENNIVIINISGNESQGLKDLPGSFSSPRLFRCLGVSFFIFLYLFGFYVLDSGFFL